MKSGDFKAASGFMFLYVVFIQSPDIKGCCYSIHAPRTTQLADGDGMRPCLSKAESNVTIL